MDLSLILNHPAPNFQAQSRFQSRPADHQLQSLSNFRVASIPSRSELGSQCSTTEHTMLDETVYRSPTADFGVRESERATPHIISVLAPSSLYFPRAHEKIRAPPFGRFTRNSENKSKRRTCETCRKTFYSTTHLHIHEETVSISITKTFTSLPKCAA